MRNDLIETSRIINRISYEDQYLFNISSQTRNLQSSQISKTKSINQLKFFYNRVIFFVANCLIRSKTVTA